MPALTRRDAPHGRRGGAQIHGNAYNFCRNLGLARGAALVKGGFDQ